jgi:hypothetical protein
MSGLTRFDNSTIRPAISPDELAFRASLDTVLMMSLRPGGTDYGPTGQAVGGEDGLASQWNGVDEPGVVAKEKVALCEHFLSRVT